jgi:hypothetical protein
LDWSSYSDWALLPYLFYFQGVPELFLQLMDFEAWNLVASGYGSVFFHSRTINVENKKSIFHGNQEH